MGRNDIRDRAAYNRAHHRKQQQDQHNQSMVIREVVRIVNSIPGKTLHAKSEIAALVELREEGALGQLDIGTTRLDRQKPDANKLGLVCLALKEAVATGVIHRSDCDGDVLLTVPLPPAEAQPSRHLSASLLEGEEDWYEDPDAFPSRFAVKLREWQAA